MKNIIRTVVVTLGLLGSGAGARAQSATVNVGAAVGSGVEIGHGASTVARQSPTFVVLNGGLLLDNDKRFEFGFAVIVELQGRVGFALEPQFRLHLPAGRRFSGYIIGGVPLFISPYTLFGVSAGPGLAMNVWHQLQVFGEGFLRFYPFGSDLPANGSLFHADIALGVRHAF